MAGEIIFDLLGSDITLISNDDARFRVHRLVLGLASPFFESMFALPKDPHESSEVPMVESAATLHAILRYIYPIAPKHVVHDIDEADELLRIARKYQLSTVEDDILYQAERIIARDQNPIRAWAFAIRVGSNHSRKAALDDILRLEDEAYVAYMKEGKRALRYVTGEEVFDLTEWRDGGVADARATLHTLAAGLRDNCGSGGFVSAIRAEFVRVAGLVNPFKHFDESGAMMLARCARKTECSCSNCPKDPDLPGRAEELKNIAAATQEKLTVLQGRYPYLTEEEVLAQQADHGGFD